MVEQWVTDEDLQQARERYAARLPGYQPPLAFTLARKDGDELTFAHVNEPGGIHRLPGEVLAIVCGHTSGTARYDLGHEQVAEAIDLLAPAEAATHWEHPNLWSWRPLLAGASEDSTFVALFLDDVQAPVIDADDAEFRRRLVQD